EGEKTFHNIFSNKIQSKILPIGNLEKTALGLLLLTDDEHLLEKFSKGTTSLHSIFELILDDDFDSAVLPKIKASLIQENPNIHSINFVKEKTALVEIKGGSDADLKKAWEDQGITIKKIDRILLNDLTKKDLPRRRFRFLTEQEVVFLKHFSK
ncbi:MAG: hypothetical protein AAF573_08525, partial [Bacteroidota bacterium]